MVKLGLSLKSPKWVKVGQKDDGDVNTYQVGSYLKVGQNHLTHFPDFNSLSSGDLIILGQSGSGFPERDSEKKIKWRARSARFHSYSVKKIKLVTRSVGSSSYSAKKDKMEDT